MSDQPGAGSAPLARASAPPAKPTGCLVLASGQTFYGTGFGAPGVAVAELCFNTAMTGYQEILTDPSYAGQIVTFTFPHIGNTGVNAEDNEAPRPVAAGMICRADVTAPSNWRAGGRLEDWLAGHGLIGLSGIDTRRLTRAIRAEGAPHAALAHAPDGIFDTEALRAKAQGFAGLTGADLASEVSRTERVSWDRARWHWPHGHGTAPGPGYRVVAIDYGAKQNILRALVSAGCSVTILPATATADEILALDPEGLFLSNGPGDPAATADYAVPTIRDVLERSDIPVFGICFGHQLLALALGARTIKMNHGHHGANHPVKEIATGKVEITAMNHGFAVDPASLPSGVEQTHVSLFDGSNCGIALTGRPVFSVQQHPEASPGPQDSLYLFERFAAAMADRRTGE